MDAHRVGSHRCVDVAAAAAGDWDRRHTHAILRLGAGNVRVLTFHLLLDVGKLVHAWKNGSVAEHRVSVVDADYWFLVVEEVFHHRGALATALTAAEVTRNR